MATSKSNYSLPLGILSSVWISKAQREQLEKLENYDLWFLIERLTVKGILQADRVSIAIRDFRRFMALKLLGISENCPPTLEVDEVWHAFILFTREYRLFCNEIAGHFIHHVPRTSRSVPTKSPVQQLSSLFGEYFCESRKFSECACTTDSGGNGDDNDGGSSCSASCN